MRVLRYLRNGMRGSIPFVHGNNFALHLQSPFLPNIFADVLCQRRHKQRVNSAVERPSDEMAQRHFTPRPNAFL